MGGDDEVQLYTAFVVPFNDFHYEKADQLGLNPDFLAKFPQGRLGERLPWFHESAGEGVDPVQRWPPAGSEEDASFTEAGHGGPEKRTRRVEADAHRRASHLRMFRLTRAVRH